MNAGKLIFAQVMEFAPWHTFRRLVAKYQGDFNVRTFSCLDQFLCMAFAQLTYRESLRDVEACLRAQPGKLYHLGLRGHVSRNTLAHANESRDWRIYGEFAQALIRIARRCMKRNRWASTFPKPFMRWIPRPSISVYLCFPGHVSERPRLR